MEEEVKPANSKVGIEPLVVVHDETIETIVGQPKA
jgi:hypothetical protein